MALTLPGFRIAPSPSGRLAGTVPLVRTSSTAASQVVSVSGLASLRTRLVMMSRYRPDSGWNRPSEWIFGAPGDVSDASDIAWMVPSPSAYTEMRALSVPGWSARKRAAALAPAV